MAVVVKTINGLAYSSVKARDGLAAALISKINGLDVTAGGGGPTLVAHTGQGGTANSVTTGAIDTTSANLLVLNFGWYPAVTDPLTISDSKSNTWTALTQHGTGGSGATTMHQRMYYCFGGTVGSGHTFTGTGTGTFPSCEVQAWSGIAASPFDQENGNQVTSATSITVGSITPGQATTLFITGNAFDGTATSGNITVSGFTASDIIAYSTGNFIGSSMFYLVLAAATPTNPVFSMTDSNPSIAAGDVTFKY